MLFLCKSGAQLGLSHQFTQGNFQLISLRYYKKNCGDKAIREICNARTIKVNTDGDTAYINIYGVTDKAEIADFSKLSADFWIDRDTRVPVKLTFYADISSHTKLIKPKPIKSLNFGG